MAFLGIAAAASVLILFESPSLRTGALLALTVWAACRFYYFLFYVLEHYVDPSLRYASVIALFRAILGNADGAFDDRVTGSDQEESCDSPL